MRECMLITSVLEEKESKWTIKLRGKKEKGIQREGWVRGE